MASNHLELIEELRNSVGILKRVRSYTIPTYKKVDERGFRNILNALYAWSQNTNFTWKIDCYSDERGHLGEFDSSTECRHRLDPSFRYYVVLDESVITDLLQSA